MICTIIYRSPKTARRKKTEKDGYLSNWDKVGKRRKKTDQLGYTNSNSLTPLLMDTAHILQFVDEVLRAKTHKRLNDLQRKIIAGILKRQKYFDIADTYGCTPGHAKDIGYKLLQMLSDIFEEPVDKGNLESVLERQLNLNINLGDRTNIFGDSNTINYINGFSEVPTTATDKSQPPNSESQRNNNQVKIEAVGKLRQLGLSDEQIAEVLGLALEVVKQMD